MGLRFLPANDVAAMPSDAPMLVITDPEVESLPQPALNIEVLIRENTRLVERVHTLEELLRRAMLTDWE